MASSDNLPQIPKNQSAISSNGVVSRDWYRFFLNLLNKVNEGGSGSGSVTSVNVSGGATGLTTSGGPITTNGTITLNGTVNVAHGGTNATTAVDARTNLGVPSTNGTGASGTWGINVTGTASTVSGLVAIANGGTNATTAADARTNLSAAQSGTNTDLTSIALTTGTITTAPSANNDIVNKFYADSIVNGVNFHAACNYATTAALAANTYNNGSSGVGATLTAVAVGTLTIDGYTFVVGDVGARILIKNEVTGANNGVYTLTQAGTALLPYILTRATDYDTSGTGTNEIDVGDLLLVLSGTANSNTSWVQQTPLPITVGTTALVFIQFASTTTYSNGTGLSLSSNTFSITNTGTAGTYGSASIVPVLTTNAQGQVTSVTNTTIAISGSAVSGNIAGSAGSVANALTIGTGLSGTSYDGSAAVTITNTGVTSLTGTASQVNVSASTGGITLSLPATINVNTSGTAANITGVLAIPNGGTGQTTQIAAITALAGTQLSGYYLRSNGTNTVLSPIQVSDVPTLNQNTTGTAGNVTGTVAILNGGTGQSTAVTGFNALAPTTTKGDLIVNNGTSNIRQAVGADTYVLTANSSAATGISWAPASGSGATITNDTTTATNVYPTFAAATSGSLSTIYTGNTKLLYKPSTGELTSSEVVASNGLFVNNQTISANYTIPAGSTAISGGPITVASGVAVTVSTGARWVTV